MRMGRKAHDSWLDKYAAPKPTVDELLAPGKQMNRVSADFLKVDLLTALTFSGIALSSDDVVKKERNRRSARRAYDTVVRLSSRVVLTPDDEALMKRDLRRLKSELIRLGEAL